MLPTPEDPSQAPIWENYIVAQVVQACLGKIPEHALAIGVVVDNSDVRLRIQLSRTTPSGDEDIDDIVSSLENLVGPAVQIGIEKQVLRAREISERDGTRWTFLSRLG